MNTVEQFNSITEMLDILNNRPNNEAMENEYASKENSKSFTGSESYEEACKLCKYGYKEILPNLKKEMNKAEKSLNKLFIHQQQFKYFNNQVGFIPNVPNLLAGKPDCMINIEKIAKKQKVMNIVYLMVANCMTDINLWVKAGPITLMAIRFIEKSGIRVRLWSCFFYAVEDDDYDVATVKIKDYNETFDLQRLSFPIAHPSMFRRLGFKQLETVPNLENEDFSNGYGRSKTSVNDYPKLKELLNIQNCKIISAQQIEKVEFDLQKTINILLCEK